MEKSNELFEVKVDQDTGDVCLRLRSDFAFSISHRLLKPRAYHSNRNSAVEALAHRLNTAAIVSDNSQQGVVSVESDREVTHETV